VILSIRKEFLVLVPILAVLTTGSIILVANPQIFGLPPSKCCYNQERSITLSSVKLTSGSTGDVTSTKASFQISINNPGAETYVESVTLTELDTTRGLGSGNLSNTEQIIGAWSVSGNSNEPINFSSESGMNELAASTTTSFTLYPYTQTSLNLSKGQTLNYAIDFTDGESLSGSVVAN
jgi:hypothetical protein